MGLATICTDWKVNSSLQKLFWCNPFYIPNYLAPAGPGDPALPCGFLLFTGLPWAPMGCDGIRYVILGESCFNLLCSQHVNPSNRPSRHSWNPMTQSENAWRPTCQKPTCFDFQNDVCFIIFRPTFAHQNLCGHRTYDLHPVVEVQSPISRIGSPLLQNFRVSHISREVESEISKAPARQWTGRMGTIILEPELLLLSSLSIKKTRDRWICLVNLGGQCIQ